MESALRSLRDVEGVLGSLLLDDLGNVLARDLPAMFDPETVSQAAQRISQLRGAFEAGAESFEGCTARFGSHLLLLRAADARTLCVLCPEGVNLKTLAMGINLVARRLSAGPTRRSWPAPPSAPPPAPSAPPPPHVPQARSSSVLSAAPVRPQVEARPELPAEAHSSTRFFRGRPVR